MQALMIQDVAMAAGIVAAYSLLQYRVIRYVRPLRCELAREGEMLLAEERLPEKYRRQVTFMLDNALNPWLTVLVALLAPFFVAGHTLRLIRYDFAPLDEELKVRYRYVDALFTRSIIAANPLGAALMLPMMAIVALYAVMLGMSWRIFDALKADVACVLPRVHLGFSH